MGITKTEAKIYSKDSKVWVGMTREDAYKNKETANIFTQVDTDSSGKITQGEIQDYDYHGESISVNNYEIYAGKKFDPEYNNNEGFKTFRNIDMDGDGEISGKEYQEFKEMVLYKQDYNNKIDEYKKGKEAIDKACDMRAKFLTGGASLGLYLGFDSVSSNAKIKFLKKIAENFTKCFKKPVIGKGLFIGGLGIGLGVLGYFLASQIFPVDKLNSQTVSKGKEIFQMTNKVEEYNKKFGIETEESVI